MHLSLYQENLRSWLAPTGTQITNCNEYYLKTHRERHINCSNPRQTVKKNLTNTKAERKQKAENNQYIFH